VGCNPEQREFVVHDAQRGGTLPEETGAMKVRRLMQLLNEMGPDNDIFVQEVTSEGRIVVETTYTIIEVYQIHNWTYINIVREHTGDH
jgi:hypothetical protein